MRERGQDSGEGWSSPSGASPRPVGGPPLHAKLGVRPSSASPEPPVSLQATSGGELHYSSVVFDGRSRGSEAHRIPCQRSPEKEPEYSVIKKR